MTHQRQTIPHPYERIADQIAALIHTGELAPGQRLPSVRDLAHQNDVADNTARDALRLLQTRGLAVIRVGRGAYVSEQPTASDPTERLRRIYSGQPLLRAGEGQVITETGIDDDPPTAVAAHLALADDQAAAYREYVVSGPTGPITAARSWFRLEVAEAVPALLGRETLVTGNLGAIKDATGRVASHMSVLVEARTPRQRERRHLSLEPGQAVLVVVTDCVEADGTVLEYNESAHPAGHVVAIGRLA